MERAKIIVKGEVQNVGFRGFVREQMLSLGLNGYAHNLPDATVEVLCEGEKDKIEGLIAKIREAPLNFATVESAEPEWQDYIGDLKEPERRGEDIPTEGTQEKMLKVMQRFDQKAEILNKRVGDVASNTGDTVTTLGAFREETNKNFTTLRQDYGKISETMEKINENIENLTKAILALAEKAS